VSKTPKMPSQLYLWECFDWDIARKRLAWRVRPPGHFRSRPMWRSWNSRYPGKDAGTIDGRIWLDGVRYSMGNILILYHFGVRENEY